MEDTILKMTAETLADLGSVLPEPFSRLMLKRLEVLGCPVTEEGQAWSLAYAARQAEADILDYCHMEMIPSVLYPILCDRACGRYLYGRRQSGDLEIEGLDLTGALASLKEGDVSVSFASGGSDGERLDALLGFLMNAGRGRLSCYRRLKW